MRASVMLAGLALLASAAVADAQDVVRLKSGKHLCGAIAIDEADKDGFTLTLWDTGGTVFVRWSQVPDSEMRRLLTKSAAAPPSAIGDILDGVRIITTTREIVGVVVKEDDRSVTVKTASGPAPVAVPKNAILRREELKIPETDAYSAEEMVARRSAGDLNAARLFELGNFARALKLFARAREFYERAAQADPARKEEAAEAAAKLDALLKEAEAEKALAAIRKLAEETKYAEAVEAANKFLDEYGDTDCARLNKDIAKKLEAEKKDFDANRDKILGQRIPEIWRASRSNLWSKYSDRKYKMAEARGAMDRLDEEIAETVAKKVNCARADAEKYWGLRDQKTVTASMGTGSWIYLGGQDGGMDYVAGSDGAKDDPVEDFRRRFGGRGDGGKDKKQPEMGQKLRTSEEWWTSASSSERQKWLQCYYGLTSAMAKKVKEEKDRDCSHCKGAGTMKQVRNAKVIDVICPRCHGAKKDVSVTFW